MSAVAALLIGLALAVWLGATSTPRLRPAVDTPPDDASPGKTSRGLHAVVSLAAGLAAWVFIGGWPGTIAGALVAAAFYRTLGALDERAERADDELLGAQAADMADMLGACVASGAGLESATIQVAAALPAPASEVLAHAAAQLSLGAPVARAWSELLGHEATAPIARAIVRSLDSGAPMADALTACAAELRDIRRARIEVMAQSVAVKAVGPLGLCFLPAFLLIGVVPLVAGLVTESIDLF